MTRVAIVAPSMDILGGQAVQAARLIASWADDPDVQAWLVPINPAPPRSLHWATRVKYLRTVVNQLLYWPLLVRELRRADVVHVFSASYFSFLLAPLPAVLVAKLLRRPVVLNYRSGEAPDHLRRSRIARAALARVDRNLVPSQFLREVFASFGLQSQVIPNIVDLDRFRFRERRPFRPRLVSTRNFEPLYNIACTLRAFRLVQDEMPDSTLALVGTGSLDVELRHLATRLGLRNVSFLGRVAPDDIWACYADADIYVQTPDIDNMPSSVLEAAASGAVVVSTNAGGVPAIVTNEVDGLLTPTGDEGRVAAAVLRVLREPALGERLARSARERCEQYAWPRVRGEWLRLYRELARQNATAARLEEPDPGRLRYVVARLRATDRREVAFRARTLAVRARRRLAAAFLKPAWRRSDLVGRLDLSVPGLSRAARALRRGDWLEAHAGLARYFAHQPSRFVIHPRDRQGLTAGLKGRFPRATDDARGRAGELLAGRYRLLGFTGLEFRSYDGFGQPGTTTIPDWHLDPVHRRHAPKTWWNAIDYLDPRYGDHKVIWELNRHQHWLALGRAYWLAGEQACSERFIAELEDWMKANPPLTGINWASMLELSMRCLSWVWAAHFFLEDDVDSRSSTVGSPWLVDLLLGLDRQMRHVEENLSQYFSPNTHLTGEALGLYVVGRVFPELRGAARWQETGRAILIEQAARQVAPDGGHAERSPHYHRYTLDFYLLALAVARTTGDRAAEHVFEPVVARLARFAWAMADATGELPHIGDDDGGQLMPLCGATAADVRPSLSIAASLLPDAVPSDEVAEESYWVAAAYNAHGDGRRHFGRPSADAWERSAVFADTGYCVSRTRSGDHMVIDAGPHGFLNGGHAHADALSMTLSLRWRRFLIDPGTGTYTMDASVRDRFRSTALHNTLVLDGRDQSDPRGPFHWRRTTDARLAAWAANPRFDFFEGVHDGYAPVRHRRVVLALGGDLWVIADRLEAVDGDARHHEAAVHWHIDPAWDIRLDAPTLEAIHPDGLQIAVATTARRLDLFHGDNGTGLGWCSPAYGQLAPCATVRFSCGDAVPFSVATVMAPLTDATHLSIRQVAVTSAAGSPYALHITRGDEVHLVLLADGSEEMRRSVPARFEGFETDARMAHVRLSRAGAVTQASLVDGTTLRRLEADAFEIEATGRVRDLAIAAEVAGAVDLFAAGLLPALRLSMPTSAPRVVRLNDQPVNVESTGTRLLISTGQQSVGTQAGTAVVVPAHADED